MINQNQKDKITTDNISLAAFLSAKGCQFLGIKLVSPYKAEFIYEDTPKTKKLIDDFWKAEGKIEPRKLLHHLKDLKTLLHQYISQGRG